MAWIRIIHEKEATGELKRMYDQNREPDGTVDNILKIHSLVPSTLGAHLALYKTLMHGPSTLTRAQREMIAVVVSAVNHCHY